MPAGLLADNLYLDMNGVVHQCRQGANSEEELIVATFQYIEALVDIVRPKKYLYMAVDGALAPASWSCARVRQCVAVFVRARA